MNKNTRFSSTSRRALNWHASFTRLRASATAFAGLSALVFAAPLALQGQSNDAWSTTPTDATFTGINWTTGTTTPGAPTGTIAAGDNLYFGTSSVVALNEDEAAGFSIGSFTFNAGASAYVISGNSFALGVGGITNNSTSLQTINDAFTLAATSTFATTAGGGDLVLGGAISGPGGLTKSGAGTLTLRGPSTFTGATNVNGGTLELGAGSGLYSAGTATGVINVNSGGTLKFSRNDSIGGSDVATIPLTLTVTGGTLTNSTGSYTSITNPIFNGGTIIDNGGAQAGYAAFRLGGTVTIGGLTATNFNIGTVVATGNVNGINLGRGASNDTTTFDVADVTGDAVSDLNVNDILRDSGNTTTGNGLTKIGAGTMTLTAANVYTGLTTVNAGTLATTTAGVFGNIANNSALVFDQTLPAAPLATGTYGGIISGPGSLAKNNAGIVVFNGANTYSGATAVNGGILYVNGSLNTASAVSVASGARLGGTGTVGTATIAAGGNVEGGQNKAGTLTLSALTFNGTATVFFGNLANYVNTPAIAAGTLTANGAASSVNLTVSGTILGAGAYQLLSYTGTIGGTGQSAFALTTPLPNRATGNLDFSQTGLIKLNVTGSDFLIWTGATTNTWDTTNSNWKLNSNGQPTVYIDSPGDSVIFDDTAGAAHTTVSLNSGDLHPTSVTFNNSALNYVLQGANAITGNAGLTKIGTGTLTISNANTYTGPTAINGGILSLGNAGALGSIGTISMGGGTLQYGAGITTDYSARFSAAANQAYSIDTNGQSVTFATALTSAGGSLTRLGAGILTLGAFETYTGGTTINGGTLTLNRGGAAGNVQGVVTVNSGGTLNLATGDALGYSANGTQVTTLNVFGGTVSNSSNGNQGYSTNLNLTGGVITGGGFLRFNNATPGSFGITTNASAVTSTIAPNVDAFNGPLNINVASGTTPSGVDLLISGVITSNSIVKSGNGYLNLTGQNTFTGPVNVSAGRLNVGTSALNAGGSGALGVSNAGKTITVGTGATLSGTTTNWFGNQANVGTLPTITVNGGTLTTSRYTSIGPVNLNGAIMSNTDTTDTGNYQSFALRGDITVGGTAASTISTTVNPTTAPTAGGLHLNTNTAFTVADATNNANVDLTVSAPLRNVSGDFGNGPGGLTKAGPGTMLLSAANTYTGPTAVNAGTLLVNGSTAAGAVNVGTTGATPTTGILGGAGTVGGATTINTGSTITGAGVGTVGALTLASTVTLTGGAYLVDISADGLTADRLNISGALTLSGATITFSGTPTQPSYVLATFASATGSFSGTAPSGYAFQFNNPTSPTELDLVAVPEPATWAAGCLLFGLVGVSQRRKISAVLAAARGC